MNTIVIIGGGIAGLYLASRLGKRAIVLERLGIAGGRIRTVRDRKTVRHDSGAWRIKAHHARMKELAEELGIQLVPMDPGTDILTGGAEWQSTRDAMLQETGLGGFRRFEAEKGYHGFGGKSAATASYGVGDKRSKHLYVKGGFDLFPAKLRQLAESRGGQVRLGHEAQYINIVDRDTPGGAVRVLGLRRDGGEVKQFSIDADAVVCCVPPHKLPTVLGEGKPRVPDPFRCMKASLQSVPLVHIYARAPGPVPPFKVVSPLPISQCIAPAAEGMDWQPCYASGEDAWFWNRLWLHDRPSFFRELRSQLGQVQEANPDLPVDLAALLGREEDVRVHFWENAVHMWLPAPGFVKMGAIRLGICPSPILHPQILVAGEAASGCQGWSEGAIRTSDMVLDRLRGNYRIPRFLHDPASIRVLYDDIEVNIPKTWVDVHPGTAHAIEKHESKDVSRVFEIVHSSDHPYRYIYSFMSKRF